MKKVICVTVAVFMLFFAMPLMSGIFSMDKGVSYASECGGGDDSSGGNDSPGAAPGPGPAGPAADPGDGDVPNVYKDYCTQKFFINGKEQKNIMCEDKE
jgi:hypothetical protein